MAPAAGRQALANARWFDCDDGRVMMRGALAALVCMLVLAMGAWPVVANAWPEHFGPSGAESVSVDDKSGHSAPAGYHHHAGHCTASICWSATPQSWEGEPSLTLQQFRWMGMALTRLRGRALDRDPPVPRRVP